MNENKTEVTNATINELKTEAQNIIIKLLPPTTHGENHDAERLYDIIQLLGQSGNIVITECDKLLKAIESWKKEEAIWNEQLSELNKEINSYKEECTRHQDNLDKYKAQDLMHVDQHKLKDEVISDLQNENQEFKSNLINADKVIEQLKEEQNKNVIDVANSLYSDLSLPSHNQTWLDGWIERYLHITSIPQSTEKINQSNNNETAQKKEVVVEPFKCCSNCENVAKCKANKQCELI